jgi:chondroitin 4-sulfotransferase 11/chondroitin 4-sulfotransferase 13/dermatan 4-sulfotransferase 1
VHWPESNFLADRERKLLYCPIMKVACSSIMRWFLRVQGMSEQEIGRREHDLVLPYQLRKCGSWRASQILLDRDVFLFAFVRNPWSRLVSAYLNQLLTVSEVSTPVLRAIQARRGSRHDNADSLQADITFEEFVDFLGRENPRSMNVHWKPQHYFLEGNRFDFIGKFERLEADFQVVNERMGTDIPLPRVNATPYAAKERPSEFVGRFTPAELRRLPAFPDYRYFYSPATREFVGRLYARDIAMFGYEPNARAA